MFFTFGGKVGRSRTHDFEILMMVCNSLISQKHEIVFEYECHDYRLFRAPEEASGGRFEGECSARVRAPSEAQEGRLERSGNTPGTPPMAGTERSDVSSPLMPF